MVGLFALVAVERLSADIYAAHITSGNSCLLGTHGAYAVSPSVPILVMQKKYNWQVC
jgi:hypothetical protein